MITSLIPGDWVEHPSEKDWGLGQVQSVDGARVTVNFEHQGKVLINIKVIDLHKVKSDDRK
ncbi:MAG: DUF3553 domain-containing protein [Alphaproteobacteria bacterium]|jgi:hypothetical protein|nr:DUF3553 domain-containing protein [Alphaproteobacteria bacterium]MBT4020282.1 DUF3553 domain-containing protein [Alphaproteobacteria bacterium]MBT4965445.1 DUF3553 domain-containing protein [Alphaproteobacteria bacterium]MBT5158464.1 DUF3553 domain-containing protein [Alphaproteobacteria bacterium]